jgi:hyperosmotically inducible protein
MKHLFAFWLPAIALAALGALSASSQDRQFETQRDADAIRTKLEREVRHQLVMLPYYGVFDNLAFKIGGDDTVTLVGEVTRPTLKSDAENVVKRIEGVAGVRNEIEVLPLSPNDERIRRAVYRAVYGDPALRMYSSRAVPPIHIIVKNGHVTLVGAVGREMDKNVANLRANGVPGVFSVTNELIVAP